MKTPLKLSYLALVAAALIVGTASAASATLVIDVAADAVGFPNTLNGQDFFILDSTETFGSSETTATKASKQNNASSVEPTKLDATHLTACRKNIKKVTCLVGSAAQGETITGRRCKAGSKAYAVFFEQLFDHYPAQFQKMFCSLRHLYVEEEFFGTAYASLNRGPNGIDGATMGIRQSVIDEGLSLSHWASWKEQLSFGGETENYSVSPILPAIQTSTKAGVNEFLYFVVAHEFGHFFDFANGLNKVYCPDGERFGSAGFTECYYKPGTWGTLSWKTDRKPRPEHQFKYRGGLCFYMCKHTAPLNPSYIPQIYESIARTNFISLYAATNALDDFAESIAYYLTDQELKITYHIDTKQGVAFDQMKRLQSPEFASKKAYLKKFLQRTDLKYP